jgi:hypothetical protein
MCHRPQKGNVAQPHCPTRVCSIGNTASVTSPLSGPLCVQEVPKPECVFPYDHAPAWTTSAPPSIGDAAHYLGPVCDAAAVHPDLWLSELPTHPTLPALFLFQPAGLHPPSLSPSHLRCCKLHDWLVHPLPTYDGQRLAVGEELPAGGAAHAHPVRYAYALRLKLELLLSA